MTDRTPFEKKPNSPTAARVLGCEEWEAMLADSLDGSLAAGDAAAFQAHSRTCTACAATFGEAQKGREWLQFLHHEPEIPTGLMEKILARTSIPAAAGLTPAVAGGPQIIPAQPAWKRIAIPVMLKRMYEPRLMMTAAMAFFSVALTLNLMGLQITSVRWADFKPSMLQKNLQRGYYTTNARVSRYYNNLRIVYEVESKMREIQRTSEKEEPVTSQPDQKDQTPPSKGKPSGSADEKSSPKGGKSQAPHSDGTRAYLAGRTIEAVLVLPRHACNAPALVAEFSAENTVRLGLSPKKTDQAERSLA